MATIKKIEVNAELKEGISKSTNQPYRFYVYNVLVNGVIVKLRPEDRTADALLEYYVDNLEK